MLHGAVCGVVMKGVAGFIFFCVERGALCFTGAKRSCVLQVIQEHFLSWTFSMRPAAVGALPHSALPDWIWQPHHCPIKGWRYSQAAPQVCIFVVTSDVASCCVRCCDEGGCRVHIFLALKGARFVPLAPNAHALSR
jgi:hypothetical protein